MNPSRCRLTKKEAYSSCNQKCCCWRCTSCSDLAQQLSVAAWARNRTTKQRSHCIVQNPASNVRLRQHTPRLVSNWYVVTVTTTTASPTWKAWATTVGAAATAALVVKHNRPRLVQLYTELKHFPDCVYNASVDVVTVMRTFVGRPLDSVGVRCSIWRHQTPWCEQSGFGNCC